MKKTISIIGGGPCALMLGAELDSGRYTVKIYEKNTALGRKFLVAGEGGLNLTHSEAPDQFIKRYTPHAFITKAFLHFSNLDFIRWLNEAGIETFVGSSKRVFPKKGTKPIAVLQILIQKVLNNKTRILYKHEWTGFSGDNELLFNTPEGHVKVKSDLVIFCLGGTSWPVTGSTGNWQRIFQEQKISVNNFQSSNCAYRVLWSESIIPDIEGQAIKNINISCCGFDHPGEIVLTRFGMEGSGIYPLSPQIREELKTQKEATVFLDLKPLISADKLIERLNKKHSRIALTTWLKEELKLNKAAIVLLKTKLSREDFLNNIKLVKTIKKLPIIVSGLAPIEEAISTVGGISLKELNDQFEFVKRPNMYAIGEMLDYDAPTGGYLLQSCFSMAKYLADYLNTEK